MQEWINQAEEDYLERDFTYKTPEELRKAVEELKVCVCVCKADIDPVDPLALQGETKTESKPREGFHLNAAGGILAFHLLLFCPVTTCFT